MKEPIKRFTLKDEHLLLLKHMHVWWDDTSYFGAPTIDTKRPFGNSGDYLWVDIHNILYYGTPRGDTKPEDLTPKMIARYQKLFRETEHALQICLQMGKFEIGKYMRPDPWDKEWIRVK